MSRPFRFSTPLAALCLLSFLTACGTDGSRDEILAGKLCDDQGKCATGFVCDLTARQCVADLPAAVGTEAATATATVPLPVAPSSTASGGDAPPPSSGLPLNTQEVDAPELQDAGGDDAAAPGATQGLPVTPTVACGVQQVTECGATEKCCSVPGAPDLCVAAQAACCIGCAEITCDGADDCASGNICCYDEASGSSGSHCVPDGQCAGRTVCGERDKDCAERSCLPIDVRAGSCGL